MHATVELKALQAAVAQVSKALAPRSTLPALSYILLEAQPDRLVLTATDLALGLVTTCPAEVDAPGSLLVPGKQLVDFLARLVKGKTTRLTLVATEKQITLTALDGVAGATATLNGLLAEEAPAVTLHTTEHQPDETSEPAADAPARVARLVTVDGAAFAAAVAQVVPATAVVTDGQRYQPERQEALEYVWLRGDPNQGLLLVQAGDGLRIHQVEVPATVYRRFAIGIRRLEDVRGLFTGPTTLSTARWKADRWNTGLHATLTDGTHGAVIASCAAGSASPNLAPYLTPTVIPNLTVTCPVAALRKALQAGAGRAVGLDAHGDGLTLVVSGGNTRRQVEVAQALVAPAPGRAVVWGPALKAALSLPFSEALVVDVFTPDDSSQPSFALLSSGSARAALVQAALTAKESAALWATDTTTDAALATATVPPAALLAAVNAVTKIAPTGEKRTTSYQNVRLDLGPAGLRITARAPKSDHDSTHSYPRSDADATKPDPAPSFETAIVTLLAAPVEGTGHIVVSIKDLKDALAASGKGGSQKGQPALVATITLTSEALLIVSPNGGHSRVERQADSCVNAPALPSRKGKKLLASFPDAAVLASAVAWVDLAASRETLRPAMTGVWIETTAAVDHAILVAADGFRLHTVTIPATCAATSMVGLRNLTKATAALHGPVTLHQQGDLLLLSDGTTTVVGQRIDARYPDYRAIIPTDAALTVIEIVPAELLQALAQVYQKDACLVTFNPPATPSAKLTVSTSTAEHGILTAPLPSAQITGPAFHLALNQGYMPEALAQANGHATLLLRFSDGVPCVDRPVVVTFPDCTAQAVIMPMHI